MNIEWEWDERAGVWTAQVQDEGQTMVAFIEDETPTIDLYVWTRSQGWDMTDSFDLGERESVEAAKEAVADWMDGGSLW